MFHNSVTTGCGGARRGLIYSKSVNLVTLKIAHASSFFKSMKIARGNAVLCRFTAAHKSLNVAGGTVGRRSLRSSLVLGKSARQPVLLEGFLFGLGLIVAFLLAPLLLTSARWILHQLPFLIFILSFPILIFLWPQVGVPYLFTVFVAGMVLNFFNRAEYGWFDDWRKGNRTLFGYQLRDPSGAIRQVTAQDRKREVLKAWVLMALTLGTFAILVWYFYAHDFAF